MITVCGEAVADLVAQDDGGFHAYPGGSPANVAVALARLGEATSFAGRLSSDLFGRRMRTHLTANRVDDRHLVRADEPSTLAVASFDSEHRATYDFWVDGTADWQWTDSDLATLPQPGTLALHTGSLASWTPPGDEALLRLFSRARADDSCTLAYDPNVRPRLMGTRESAVGAVEAFVALAHLVKVSDEDLAWLCPDQPAAAVARRWSGLGPALVVVTTGGGGAFAVRRGLDDEIAVATPSVTVLDTIGAGDTFTAGLLHALRREAALGPEAERRLSELSTAQVTAVLRRAAHAAALTCTRAGCDPPTRSELDEFEAGRDGGSA